MRYAGKEAVGSSDRKPHVPYILLMEILVAIRLSTKPSV